MTIRPHRAPLFVFAIKDQTKRRKVFQVGFLKSDGSIFINTPYFDSYEGLVSLIELPPSNSPDQEISVSESGKVTSHLLKYSHHPSGVALFSQTGRVKSEIRKDAFPLNEATGHICSVQLQGLASFKQLKAKDEDPERSDRMLLGFDFPSPGPDAYRFDVHQYSYDEMEKRLEPGGTGPLLRSVTSEGESIPGFLISSPEGNPRDNFFLIVKCRRTKLLDKESEKVMTFIGGFDQSAKDPLTSTSCLVFVYPARDVAQLKNTIGTIDFEVNGK